MTKNSSNFIRKKLYWKRICFTRIMTCLVRSSRWSINTEENISFPFHKRKRVFFFRVSLLWGLLSWLSNIKNKPIWAFLLILPSFFCFLQKIKYNFRSINKSYYIKSISVFSTLSLLRFPFILLFHSKKYLTRISFIDLRWLRVTRYTKHSKDFSTKFKFSIQILKSMTLTIFSLSVGSDAWSVEKMRNFLIIESFDRKFQIYIKWGKSWEKKFFYVGYFHTR